MSEQNDYPNRGFAEGVSDTLNANRESAFNAPDCDGKDCNHAPDGGENYVVDVFIPVAIPVRADNAEQAASMAIDALYKSGVREDIDRLIDGDPDSGFVVSDSPAQTEVGEA